MVSPNPGLLAALLKTGRLLGVMRWKVSLSLVGLQTEGQLSNKRPYFLDTQAVSSLEDFFSVAAKQLDLPPLSLANFESVLSSLETEQSGAVLVWTGWQDLVKNNLDDAKALATIFEQAAQNWPGVVLVTDPKGNFPDLPELMSA